MTAPGAPKVRVEHVSMMCTPSVLEHLKTHHYDQAREQNLARRCGIKLNAWINKHAHEVEFPLDPTIRPVIFSEKIAIAGKMFTLLSLLRFGRIEPETLQVVLRSEVFLTTDAESIEILGRLINGPGIELNITEDDAAQ